MKTRFALLVLVAVSFNALSQDVENDDMYFSKKDREKLNVLRTNLRVAEDRKADQLNRQENLGVNPTDSYSARNISPEYISRSRSASDDSVNGSGYFESTYSPTAVNRNLYNGFNYNNSFYSPYYGGGCMSCFNNFNNGFGSYGMSPFGFSPGLSMGMGYGFGMNSGWYGGMGYGMGYGWGMPSNYFWNSWYDPFWGYNSYNPWNNWYGGGFGFPGSVIVINNDNTRRNMTYQRRYDRSSTLNNDVTSTGRPIQASTTRNGRVINGNSSGRVTSTQNAQAQDYYQPGWRSNSAQHSPSRTSQWGNTSNNSGRVRSWDSGNQGNSGFNNWGDNGSNSRSSSWGDGGSNSRSSWSTPNSGGIGGGGGSIGGGGGGSRSSGGGGGGGGGTRGRH